jgi:glycerol-3-phosphate dehydrogenase
MEDILSEALDREPETEPSGTGTGAGIFRELASRGARVVLVDQNDFASGTSSRSSKLIHGGLHYLARTQWRLDLQTAVAAGF